MKTWIRRVTLGLMIAVILSSLARLAPAGSTADRRQFLNRLAGTSHTVTVEAAAHRKPIPPKPKKLPPKPKKPPSGGGHSKHATPHVPTHPVHVLHP